MKPIYLLTITSLVTASLAFSACAKEDATPPSPKKEDKAKPVTKATKAPSPSTKAPSQASPDEGALKPIMVGLGEQMAIVQAGIWTENFDLIAEAAMKVADHPKVSDAEKKRVIATLGKDFGAFVALDKAVHSQSVALATAAKEKEMATVLTSLATLQSGCVGCHSQFRAKLTP